MADEPKGSNKTAAGKTTPSARRRTWHLACARIAVVAGIFSLVLGGVLLFNSVRLYRGAGNGKVRLVEAQELLPLKAALREDPKNEPLKEQIRQLDQQLRQEYFRREQLAANGGWWLVASAVVFLSALQAALYFKRPPLPVPVISARRIDPAEETLRAGQAVAAAGLALAGLTTALVWGTDKSWHEHASQTAGAGGAAVANAAAPPAADPQWFAPQEEVDRNWPRFRGPAGTGVATIPGLPDSWDGPSGKNILWKTALNLPGENSPVVWGDRLFLTGATADKREVCCFDAATGALLWSKPVSTPQGSRAEPPEVMEDTGHAAPTPVTDGRRVCAMFANGEIAAFDFEGKPLWARHLGTPQNSYGHATSLAMWRNLVIVVFDQAAAEDKLSKILALDAASGETVWSTPRPVPNSWVSPIVITVAGKPQIITCADPWVIAYNPENGKELWKAECLRGDVAPSPVFANDLVYVANDGACVAAIRPDGSGDVTKDKVVWKWDEGSLPDMCSLLCDGPRFLMITYGSLQALDALTGKHLWEHDLESEFHASPTLVNGKLWLVTRKGTTIIGEATNEGFKETGRCELGEDCNASPSFGPGRLYLRGKEHLYCIGTKDGQ